MSSLLERFKAAKNGELARPVAVAVDPVDDIAKSPAVVPRDELTETVETLKSYLEHAPENPGTLSLELMGWSIADGRGYLCSGCSGRIVARGCPLPRGADPVWESDIGDSLPDCCTCGKPAGSGKRYSPDGFDFLTALKLVADTPEKLRPCDLMRLFDSVATDRIAGMRDYVLRFRPDLREGVAVAVDTVTGERAEADKRWEAVNGDKPEWKSDAPGWSIEDIEYLGGEFMRWHQSPCGRYRIAEKDGVFYLQEGRGIVRRHGEYPTLGEAVAYAELLGSTGSEPQPEPQPATVATPSPVASISSNNSGTSIRLAFPDKPEADILAQLRAAGFRWNRTGKYWYHKDTPENREAVARITGAGFDGVANTGETGSGESVASIDDNHADAETQELRESLKVSAESLAAYDPEEVPKKYSGRWAIDDINGLAWPLMFKTRTEAVEQARRHKELKQAQYDNPRAYTDLHRVRAAKSLARIEELTDAGMSMMEAGKIARAEFPEPLPVKPPKGIDHASIAEKFRVKAEQLAPKVDHLLRPMDQNPTAKRIGQYHSRRLDGERLERVREAFTALAELWDQGVDAVPEALRDWRKPSMDALGWMAKETRHVSNGYHGYLAETGDWKPVADLRESRIAGALRELIDPAKQEQRKRDLELRTKLDALRLSDIEGFFPTPDAVVEEMIERAEIEKGHHVLEPSVGIGSIAEKIAEVIGDGRLVMCEVRSSLCDILRAKMTHETRQCDFLEQVPAAIFDRVLMNPPFERGQDADHVRHAFGFLKPGGRLVAIVSAGLMFRSDRKATEFREWLKTVSGDVYDVDGSHYRSAGAFRQTGCECKMIVVDSPE